MITHGDRRKEKGKDMSKKKKSIIISIAVLLVVLTAVSIISYSIAGLGHGDETISNIAENNLTNRGGNLDDMTYMTNIDLIIDSALNDSDYTYNIVEIVPSGVGASDLQTYASNEGFSNYVISAHKESVTSDMPAGRINYKLLTVHAGVTLADTYEDGTVQTLLDEADLIYMNSPGYTSFDGTNNISEDLFNYLHVYALGSDKPIIMDYVTSSTVTAESKKYYSTLANTISRNHIKFRTYSWTQGLSAQDFFSASGSYYLKYNVNSLSGKASGKVLVVTANGTPAADSMYQRMVDFGSDKVIENAYYGQNNKPDAMQYTIWNLADGPLTTTELDKGYDFILLENDIASIEIPSSAADITAYGDVYKKLKSLSESSKYILYDARMVSGSSSGEEVAAGANNYLKLMDMLISNKGVARYSHVLAISNGFFTSLVEQGADGTAGAKAIADIINAGDYRGSGSTGANGKKFRVLELQPCYPIDLEVAKDKPDMTVDSASRFGLKGNYYEKPSEVLKSVTKDEVEEGTEYYAFELSKAKIAYATGLNMNQIQVDQMSTDELISKKETLLESYDLIYVGGNTSALTPYSLNAYVQWRTAGDLDTVLKQFTAFDMYTHTGVSVWLQTYGSNSSTGDYKSGTIPYGAVPGHEDKTFVELNGNDITKHKLDEFTAYIDAGMPIIFESTVTEAFENMKDASRLEQLAMHDIDPDCFMYDLLYSAYKDKDKKNSIKWGLQATDRKDETGKNIIYTGVQTVDNSDKKYGNTLGDVTVFTDTVGADVKAVVNASNTRPTMTLTERPKDYIEGNANSYNRAGEDLTIKGTVSLPGADTADIALALYTDYNGDGIFSDDELADSGSYSYSASATNPGEFTLVYDIDENFYGLVSWKVVATAKSGSCDVTKGYAFYPKPEDAEKKEVRILQLMPVRGSYEVIENGNADEIGTYRLSAKGQSGVNNTNYGQNDGHTLYFCIECQMAQSMCLYNIVNGSPGSDTRMNVTGLQSNAVAPNVNVGLHEHKFGIVRFDSTIRYGTTVGDEDWNDNLADPLMDDYDFDLDIMSLDEFEQYVAFQANESHDEDEAAAFAAVADEIGGADGTGGKIADKLAEANALEAQLIEELEKLKNNTDFRETDQISQWIADKEYYMFWFWNNQYSNGTNVPQSLTNAYNKYIAVYDEVVKLRQQYKFYSTRSFVSDAWLTGNYDVIVLGFAEDFGGNDLSLTAIEQIKSYLDAGGSMLNTHDVASRYADGGAVRLTDNLRGYFGMDRFHVTGANSVGQATATFSVPMEDNEKKNETVAAEIRTPLDGNLEFGIMQWALNGNVPVTNKDLDITVTVDQYYYGNIKNIEIKEGAPHDGDITISMQFVRDDGASVGVNDLYLSYECNGSEKFGGAGTPTGIKTNSEGKVEFTVPQNYTATSYASTISLYKQDLEYDLTMAAEGTATTNLVSQGNTKKVGEDLTVTFNVKNADGTPAADGVTVVLGNQTAATSGGKAQFTVTPNTVTKTVTASATLTNYDVEYNMSVGADGNGVLSEVQIPNNAAKGAGETLSATLHITDADGGIIADGTSVSCSFNGSNQTVQTTGGTATFTNLPQPTVASGVKYQYYNTADKGLYFWTERALNGDSTTLDTKLSATYGYRSVVGVTDPVAMFEISRYQQSPYLYAEYQTQDAIHWNYGYGLNRAADGKDYGTNGASQVNDGIVTTYPFTISSELRLAPTHVQPLALDMEDEEVAVWYTLSAGSSACLKPGASYFAATPHDGMDAYYLYSKGNIFYCGAGNTVVTGPERDNNDERRLFINIIVNTVRNKGAKPKITVHEPDGKGDPIDKTKEEGNIFLNPSSDSDYIYNIDSNEGIPNFDFKVKIDSSTTLKQVYVYYDLNYGTTDGNYSNDYTADQYHVMIAEYNTNTTVDAISGGTLSGGELAEVRYDPDDPSKGKFKNLQLKPEYFTPYAGKYTYIVIKAVDSKGNVTYSRIKINLIPKLFDLT